MPCLARTRLAVFTPSPILKLLLLAAMTLGPAAAAPAQIRLKEDKKPDDPKAVALLADVVQAYKALHAYSDQGEFQIAITVDGKQQKQNIPLSLTLVRPDKLDLQAGEVRLSSDGKSLITLIPSLKRYTTVPAPKTITLEIFREGAVGAILFTGPSGVPTFVLLNLLTQKEPEKAIEQLGGSIQLAPKKGQDQTSSILIDFPEAPDLLLAIDPQTKLLSAIDLQVDAERLAARLPAGKTLTVQKIGWNSGKIETSVAADRSFALAPPAGFKKVDSLIERDQTKPENPQLGTTAPQFTLTVLDGPDKTRTVTKTDLQDKVVVLDFWATWCGPCLMELPEIQKLIDHYAKNQNVFIVAVSQDNDPGEISQVRKLVEKTLADKKINLLASPAGHIALDPSNTIGNAFGVEGFPTLVLIDRKGVIQSIHLGYDPNKTEPLHQELAHEIDQLLEGNPLVQPKTKPAAAENDEKK